MARHWRAVCWALALVVCAASVTRCGSSTPSPTAVTTTTGTTSAVTTTSVAPIAPSAAHYAGTLVQAPPLPPVPLDLSLFFQIPGGSLRPAIRPLTVNFLVTGGYTTGPDGFSGNISGTLDGSPANGTFTGTMTANLATGCIAKRNYSGPLTTAALNWTPGDQIETCGGTSPLTFTVTPPAAPTPATTSLPTTTTIGACAYSLSIGSTIDGYPTGGTFSANVTTQAGCSWSAVSNAPWIHITVGSAGTGSGTVTFTADANPTPARTGTLIIAGQTITFNQGSTSTTTTSTSTTTSVATTTTTSLLTTSTTSTIPTTTLTTFLSGRVAFTVTSPTPGYTSFTCSFAPPAQSQSCSVPATGTIQLNATQPVSVDNCTQTSSTSCEVTITSSNVTAFLSSTGGTGQLGRR